MIAKEIYKGWKDQPILHDEDYWDGKYKTYGEMWIGEGYMIEGNFRHFDSYGDLEEISPDEYWGEAWTIMDQAEDQNGEKWDIVWNGIKRELRYGAL